MLRCFSLLVLTSSFALAACADDPPETPTVPAPTTPVEADTPLGPEPREEEPQIPADSVVVPDLPPASPTPPAAVPDRPSAPDPSEPSPERPTAPEAPEPPTPTDPDPEPPTSPGTDRTAVESFWTRFQGALRARDASAIDDYLHTTVRVSGQAYDRDGPQVQEVVRQFAENPDLTEAYLDTSADELVVTDGRATFSSVARYTLADEPYEVTVSGVLREVTPGTWRIVELASEPR
ncbi:MAG: hypothetical protein Rubg2KO_38100 [Rubricoccaceae bacterium]